MRVAQSVLTNRMKMFGGKFDILVGKLPYNLCSFEFGKAVVMYTRLGVHYGSLKDSDAFFGGEQLRRVAKNGL